MKPKGIANRNTANYRIEKQYICFYEGSIDLAWAISDVDKFKTMWEGGMSIQEIAVALRRHPLEVTLLLIDLAESDEGDIERRPVSIYGRLEL